MEGIALSRENPRFRPNKGAPLKRLVALCLALSGALLGAPGAVADHDDGIYELPAIAQWDETHLDVLVVPPNHGQIYNSETGILKGYDPNEATPFNSYLVAIEEALDAWESAIHTLGSTGLRSVFKQNVYVLGRDTVPPAVLADPDILVVTDEDEGGLLGTAVRVVPCIVRMSKSSLMSFTTADMYNVTMQEYGHCLGLRHVGSQGGVDPTSDRKHPEHDVMNGFYTHSVGAAGTHRHCISNLNVLALEFVFGTKNTGMFPTSGPTRTLYMPVDAYGDTCAPPPADWRKRTDAAGQTAPGQQPPPAPPAGQAPASEITTPTEGSNRSAASFRAVKGTAGGEGLASVEVALARKVSGGCKWWDGYVRSFVKASCDEPLWNDAAGTETWKLPVAKDLAAGRYEAWSRAIGQAVEDCCERGRNRISFRLR